MGYAILGESNLLERVQQLPPDQSPEALFIRTIRFSTVVQPAISRKAPEAAKVDGVCLG